MPHQSNGVARRLAALSADYREVTGRSVEHFFCPILYRDEDVELCEAHIVNEKFGASSAWTVQRKDVDAFYGSRFESDFVLLKERGKHNLAEAITNAKWSKRLGVRVVADGQPIDYYAPQGLIPKDHTRMIIGAPGAETHLALKVPPAEAAALADATWRIEMVRDIRIAALVSLLKAAHLTLFNMLGYRYALSSGGHFLGHDILGRFFLENSKKPRTQALAAATSYFREFEHLVRPIKGIRDSFKGTIEENQLYLCERGAIRWGFIVIVRTSPDETHAALAPFFQEPVAAKLFMDFLRSSSDEEITTRVLWFRGERWEGATKTEQHRWPKTGILYPDGPPLAESST